MSNSLYPKKYITETWKSYKYITFPGTNKDAITEKLKFPQGIRFGIEGVTADLDKDDIIKDALLGIFEKAKDLEPNAPEMEVDWMKEEKTIQVVFKYPKKNVHYFFRWWLDEREMPGDDEENAKDYFSSY